MKESESMVVNALRIAVSACPSTAQVGEEAQVQLTVYNPTNKDLTLLLSVVDSAGSKNSGLTVVGITSRVIGGVESGGSIALPLTVFATRAGLQVLRGVRLADAMKKEQLFSPETEICRIFVTDEEEPIQSAVAQLTLSNPLESIEMARSEALSASPVKSYYPRQSKEEALETAPEALPLETTEDYPLQSFQEADVAQFVAPDEQLTTETGDVEADAVLAEVAEMQEVGVNEESIQFPEEILAVSEEEVTAECTAERESAMEGAYEERFYEQAGNEEADDEAETEEPNFEDDAFKRITTQALSASASEDRDDDRNRLSIEDD